MIISGDMNTVTRDEPTANNAHDVDNKGPITSEVPFDSDSHTDGAATAAGVDDTDVADDKPTAKEARDGVDKGPTISVRNDEDKKTPIVVMWTRIPA
jgi:hypothetical protein